MTPELIYPADLATPAGVLREAALGRLRVLDSLPEAKFEAVVGVAQRTFGCKIAMVCLIDESRQWFKAEVGLGLRETPMDR